MKGTFITSGASVPVSGTRSLSTIAFAIADDWGVKTNYAARPYLQAMSRLNSIDDVYGHDSARDMVLYFLSNAQSWRGETARAIKAELRAMLGGAA